MILGGAWELEHLRSSILLLLVTLLHDTDCHIRVRLILFLHLLVLEKQFLILVLISLQLARVRGTLATSSLQQSLNWKVEEVRVRAVKARVAAGRAHIIALRQPRLLQHYDLVILTLGHILSELHLERSIHLHLLIVIVHLLLDLVKFLAALNSRQASGAITLSTGRSC